MPFLYLIRHPHTKLDPSVPASQWRLTEDGHAQVQALVAAPFWNGVDAVYTSQEYKTTVVGEAVYAAHGIPFTPVENLGEARRDKWVNGNGFQAAQQAFFAHLDVPPMLEWESAEAAGARFVTAINGVLEQHPPTATLTVVSHATVLTLYVAHLRAETPSYEWWSRIGFAEVLAVDRVTMRPATPFLAAPYDQLPLP